MSYHRGSAHRDCNISLKLNYKYPIVFHNLKNYDFQLTVQELGEFTLKVCVILNEIEKYMGFTINDKLFLLTALLTSSSLDSLVKNLNKDDFWYLGQKRDKNKLDIIKQTGFYCHEYKNGF